MSDGFYEWQKLEEGGKQVWRIEQPDAVPFAFAGLWERWQGPDGVKVDTCTIITIAANDLLAPIHERMPVTLQQADYEAWLDTATPAEKVRGLVRQPNEDFFTAYKIGPELDRTQRVA